jgi:hypothetical protein
MTAAELILRRKTLDPGTPWYVSAPALADALATTFPVLSGGSPVSPADMIDLAQRESLGPPQRRQATAQ